MFLSKESSEYYIVIAGRESDITILVKHQPNTTLTLILKPSVTDQSAHNKEMSPQDAIAIIYKLWNDGELFPTKLLINLQNDVINHILNQHTYGIKKDSN
jgi:hypothetical protein